MKASHEEKKIAIDRIREILQPGDKVYCILRHRSASGMTRVIEFIAIKDNAPRRLSGYISDALGMPYNRKHDGVTVRGCGMDMGFHVVYNLGRALFPDGYGVWPLGGEHMPKTGVYRTPISAEDAATMAGQGFKFYGRNGDTSGWDDDGGYALKSEWL